MIDAVLAEVLSNLDMVVLERLPEGVFLRIGPAHPPVWFDDLFRDAPRNQPITVGQVLPFVDHFLGEAEKFWREGGQQRLRSEPFTMSGASGDEVPLVATAVAVRHRRFLIIERPAEFAERQDTLQTAREQALKHEEHVRHTGALAAPVEAAQQLVQQLLATGLTADQAQLAAGIRDHLTGVTAAIQAIAPVPSGVSRRQRS